jgi:hypothetical protein
MSPGLAGLGPTNTISNLGNFFEWFVNSSGWPGWTSTEAGVTATFNEATTVVVAAPISSSLSGEGYRVKNLPQQKASAGKYYRPKAAITALALEPLEILPIR